MRYDGAGCWCTGVILLFCGVMLRAAGPCWYTVVILLLCCRDLSENSELLLIDDDAFSRLSNELHTL